MSKQKDSEPLSVKDTKELVEKILNNKLIDPDDFDKIGKIFPVKGGAVDSPRRNAFIEQLGILHANSPYLPNNFGISSISGLPGAPKSKVQGPPPPQILSDAALHNLITGLMLHEAKNPADSVGYIRAGSGLGYLTRALLQEEGRRHPIAQEKLELPSVMVDHVQKLYELLAKDEKARQGLDTALGTTKAGKKVLNETTIFNNMLFVAYSMDTLSEDNKDKDPKKWDKQEALKNDFLPRIRGENPIDLATNTQLITIAKPELNLAENKITTPIKNKDEKIIGYELKDVPAQTEKRIKEIAVIMLTGDKQSTINKFIDNLGENVKRNTLKANSVISEQAEKLGKNITKQTGKIAESFEKQANSTIKNISTKIDKLGETIKSGSVKTTNAISDQAKKLGKNIINQTEKFADQVAKKGENFKDSASKNLNINKIQKLASSFKKQANYTFENIKNILKNDDLKKLLNKEKLKIPPVQNRAAISFTSTPEKRPSPPSAPPPLHLLKNENNSNKGTSSKSINPSQTPPPKNNNKKNKSTRQNSRY